MSSAINDNILQVKQEAQTMRLSAADTANKIREGAKIRAVLGLFISVVILIIAWAVAGVMRQKAVYIVAGIASALALLFMLQFIPATLRYVKVDEGYIVFGCRKFLRPCFSVPERHFGQPVIGIADGVFKGSKKMYYITLPATIKQLGNGVFEDCRDLRFVMLPSENSLTKIGDNCFKGCVNLTSFISGDNLESIGKRCFDGCNVLQLAYLGCKITSLGEGAFSGCGNLRTFNLSEKVTSLGKRVFESCCNIKELILPPQLERIDTECFSYCNGVKSIILPPRLNYIGQNAFKDCSSAEIIEISSKPSFIGEGAFRNCAKAVLRFVNTKKAQSGWNGQCFDNRMTVIYAK